MVDRAQGLDTVTVGVAQTGIHPNCASRLRGAFCVLGSRMGELLKFNKLPQLAKGQRPRRTDRELVAALDLPPNSQAPCEGGVDAGEPPTAEHIEWFNFTISGEPKGVA